MTDFPLTPNNVSAKVGPTGYAAGSGTLALQAGDGAKFPSPAPGQWLRVTVVRRAVAYSPLATLADLTIYRVVGIAGDTLTIDSVLEGTTDRNYVAGDVVECRLTGGHLEELQDAANALEGDVDALQASTATLATDLTSLRGDVDAIESDSTIVRTTTTYADPAWLSISQSKIIGLLATLAAKAPLDSPGLTGTPTAPTATAGTNTTQVATTAFVVAGLALKANDVSVVHKTGPETIAGEKTCTDNFAVDSSASHRSISVSSPGNPQLRVISDDGVIAKLQSLGNLFALLATEISHDLRLGTNNTSRATITALGKFLINATAGGSQGGQLEARSPDASTPIFAGYDYLGISRFLVGPDGTATINNHLLVQGRIRSTGNSTLSGSGAAEIANVASFGWSFQSLSYGFYAANGVTPYLVLEGAKATLWLPLVLPELPDASIPNGGLAWSSTSPGELRARTPAGIVKTVTMT